LPGIAKGPFEESAGGGDSEQRMLLDNIDTMVWYATDTETYGLANKARADFLGLTKEELVGRRMREFLPEEACEMCIEGNIRAFRGEKVTREEWVTTHEGEARCVLVSKAPRFNERGEVEYVFCTATDITEMKNMESALRLVNEKLNLLFGVTRHDMMNQLTILQGYLDLLRDPSCKTTMDYYDRMEAALYSVMDHLRFTKEMEVLGSEPLKWINLSEPIERALSRLDLNGLEARIEGVDGIKIFSDPMIWKVFYNLAHNTTVHASGATFISIFPEERRAVSALFTRITALEFGGTEEASSNGRWAGGPPAASIWSGRYSRSTTWILRSAGPMVSDSSSEGRPIDGGKVDRIEEPSLSIQMIIRITLANGKGHWDRAVLLWIHGLSSPYPRAALKALTRLRAMTTTRLGERNRFPPDHPGGREDESRKHVRRGG